MKVVKQPTPHEEITFNELTEEHIIIYKTHNTWFILVQGSYKSGKWFALVLDNSIVICNGITYTPEYEAELSFSEILKTVAEYSDNVHAFDSFREAMKFYIDQTE